MITANPDITTSRRQALRGTFATVIAGTIAVPGIAAARSSGDARLISLYAQLATLDAKFDALFGRRTTIAEEKATEHEMDVLHDRRDALMAQLEAAGPPQTMAGVIATARTALAMHYQRDTDGTAIANDDSHFLLLMTAEALIANT